MTQPGEESSLAAILSAHGAGDDSREQLLALVESHGGGVVDVPGDHLLAAFADTLEAAQCALEIQAELDARNAELPLDQVAAFRIGVHRGDVLADGVDVATGLAELATPGGICCSGLVHDEIAAVLAVRFEDLGPRALPEIESPVQVWRVQGQTAAHSATARRPRRSIGLPVAAGLVLGALTTLVLWMSSAPETPPPPLEPRTAELPPAVVETYEALLIGAHYDASHDEMLARIGTSTREALVHAPDSAMTRNARALLHLGRREHGEAIAEADRALMLEPDAAMSHRIRAAALAYSGQPFAALEQSERARGLDPASPAVYLIEGRSYRQLGRRDAAIEAYEQALALSPDAPGGLATLAVLYAETGREQKSRSAVERVRELQPDFSGADYAAALPFADPLDAERLAQGLAKVGLP
jgi:tetratricopeptide (TPR) repeat protein